VGTGLYPAKMLPQAQRHVQVGDGRLCDHAAGRGSLSRSRPNPLTQPAPELDSPAAAADTGLPRGGDAIRRLLPAAILGPILLAFLRFACVQADLVSAEAGTWILVIAIVILFGGLLLMLAGQADREEAQRRRIERENEAAAPALAQRALELEEANEELAAAKAQLERSNAELQQFATVASHDLREPLRVVSGFADLLARRYADKLEGDAPRFIEAITAGVKRMDEMIADLLAYARAGRADRPPERVDTSEVVADALAGLQRAIADAGADVEVGELPVIVGHPAALRQVFQNLIANALKFVGEDPPRIRIWAAEVPHGWRFAVRDNGIGVSQENAERIFGMFTRLHDGERFPGTGVGLALCQRIVGMHGGRIWVEPAPGGGSQFMFTLAANAPQ
jgi:signal transduction histidine kinase